MRKITADEKFSMKEYVKFLNEILTDKDINASDKKDVRKEKTQILKIIKEGVIR